MYIEKIVVWKRHLHLETLMEYWKQKLDIGNMKRRLETASVYWKHKNDNENKLF